VLRISNALPVVETDVLEYRFIFEPLQNILEGEPVGERNCRARVNTEVVNRHNGEGHIATRPARSCAGGVITREGGGVRPSRIARY